MGRGVTVCDWTKQIIGDEDSAVDVNINGEEFVFSQEGFEAMMEHLHGNQPLTATAIATPLGAPTILTNEDRRPPRRTPEEQQRILEESIVAEPGYLENLGSKRSEAQKRLDEMNRQIDLDLDNEKKKVED